MIATVFRAVAGFVVRSCIELGLALFIAAALFLFVAYKTARRFATNTPDGFDKVAARLATALGVVAAVRARQDAAADDDLAGEPAEDWREYVP